MNKKTVIIICVAIAVVLLCCISATVLTYLVLLASRSNTGTSNISPTTPVFTVTPFTTTTPAVTQTSACEPEDVGLTDADFDMLLEAYEDPFVIQVRTSLNDYLAGTNASVSDLAIEGIGTDNGGKESGLDNFSRSYYSSKFLVYYINNDPAGGGKNITVLFKDRPDALFTAWIYDISNGGYEMRGFWKEDFTAAEMREVQEEAGCLMQDSRFSL